MISRALNEARKWRSSTCLSIICLPLLTSAKSKRLRGFRRGVSVIALWTAFLFLLMPISFVHAYCDKLQSDTWEELVRVLDNSTFDFALLCPFEIQGNGCPSTSSTSKSNPTYVVKNRAQQLIVGCANYLSGEEVIDCSIDCPHTHFVVPAGQSLKLQSMKLRGSSSSAIVVESGGSLVLSDCLLEMNQNDNLFLIGSGGAIRAESGSSVELNGNTVLRRNSATRGGAIDALGKISLRDVELSQNHATIGGALYLGSDAEAKISAALFTANVADEVGPAIYSDSANDLQQEDNVACENSGASGDSCNGVAIGTSCTLFETICDAPTPFPSSPPSDLNDSSVTAGPTATRDRTAVPTASPSAASPTAAPTAVAPSVRPSTTTQSAVPTTPAPSSIGSATPSNEPTRAPGPVVSTVAPSNAEPTRNDTGVDSLSPSWSPVSQPSRSQTPIEATTIPSQPSPSQSPEQADPSSVPMQSDLPTLMPSLSVKPSSAPSVSVQPSAAPTVSSRPSSQPSEQDTVPVTTAPPSLSPSSDTPTTVEPTFRPSVPIAPSSTPTLELSSQAPTEPSTNLSTRRPSSKPFAANTSKPSMAIAKPTGVPFRRTRRPTRKPTIKPVKPPTKVPTVAPRDTKKPSRKPVSNPTKTPEVDDPTPSPVSPNEDNDSIRLIPTEQQPQAREEPMPTVQPRSPAAIPNRQRILARSHRQGRALANTPTTRLRMHRHVEKKQ